jgi:acetyl esterase/lipase
MTWVQAADALLAESRSLNAGLEQLLATAPSVHTVPPAVTRAQRAEGKGIFPMPMRLDDARTRAIPGPAGDIPLRVFVPERVDGVYLHIHGGGWVFGAADQQDHLLHALATQAHVAVVSVDYRLAPEHPFPAAPDDCEAAAHWLVEHAARKFGSDRLLIGGESAGAHLAALTLLRLRDNQGAVAPFRAANLVFGAFDLGMTPSARTWGERNLVLSTPIIEWFADQFTPGLSPEERRVPGISPLWADLRELPPALFTVGTLDPLLDDSLFMHARWRAVGNDAELLVYPESVHGFHAFPTGIAMMAIEAQLDFLRRALAAA